MKPFELAEPSTLTEAIALLDPADTNVRAIAGGTALMLMMKARLFQPTRLVSLHKLNGSLRGVSSTGDGGLRIGALTSLREMERSSTIRESVPVITRALRTLSNVRVRNVATLGGHLAHGDPHMDLPPILLTLGARARTLSPRGPRLIDISDLFLGYYQTSLAADELIEEVTIPAQPSDARAAYAKCTTLNADDWPAVGVAVWFRLDEDGIIREPRVAISAATERPLRARTAEQALAGARADLSSFSRASDAAAEELETLADIRGSASYKREMLRVHVRRALQSAVASRPNGT
ncbi:MAG: FAD binding domain-containing protein [Candidatus Acidiferrales bacterium]